MSDPCPECSYPETEVGVPCPRCQFVEDPRRREERILNEHKEEGPRGRFTHLERIAVDHEKRLDDLTARVKNAESRLSLVAAAERARESARAATGIRSVPTGPWPPQAGDLAQAFVPWEKGIEPFGPALRVVGAQGGYVRLEGEREWRANGSVRVVARKEDR